MSLASTLRPLMVWWRVFFFLFFFTFGANRLNISVWESQCVCEQCLLLMRRRNSAVKNCVCGHGVSEVTAHSWNRKGSDFTLINHPGINFRGSLVCVLQDSDLSGQARKFAPFNELLRLFLFFFLRTFQVSMRGTNSQNSPCFWFKSNIGSTFYYGMKIRPYFYYIQP